jgi:hypothetical protein
MAKERKEKKQEIVRVLAFGGGSATPKGQNLHFFFFLKGFNIYLIFINFNF